MASYHQITVSFSTDTVGDDAPARALVEAIELIAPFMVDNVSVETLDLEDLNES
jgi:hypothetical protein